jgi:hypothetical protein
MKKNNKETLEKPTSRPSDDIQGQAHDVLKVWKANPEFRMQENQFEDFEKIVDEWDKVLEKIKVQKRALHELLIVRDKLQTQVDHLSSRARSGMRGYFGPNSPEYQHVRRNLPPTPVRKAKKPSNRMNLMRQLDPHPTATPPAAIAATP